MPIQLLVWSFVALVLAIIYYIVYTLVYRGYQRIRTTFIAVVDALRFLVTLITRLLNLLVQLIRLLFGITGLVYIEVVSQPFQVYLESSVAGLHIPYCGHFISA